MKYMPPIISSTPVTCFHFNGLRFRILSVTNVTATVSALAVIDENCSGYFPSRNPYRTEPTLLRTRKRRNFHLLNILKSALRLKSVGLNSFSSVCEYFSMKGLVPPQKRLTTKKGRMSCRVSAYNISKYI
jgi:hypothetical protein